MRIKFLHTVSNGVKAIRGDVKILPDAQAQRLIDGGIAELFSGEEVIVAEDENKTPIQKTDTILNVNKVLHLVSSGKIFYLTDVICVGRNNNTSTNFTGSIRDNSIDKIGLQAVKSIAGQIEPTIEICHAFKEPVEFSNDVNFYISQSSLFGRVTIIGYEK